MSSTVNTATINALVLVNVTSAASAGIKANKLRKVVCKSIPSCSCDEFKDTLEVMVEAGKVVRGEDGVLRLPEGSVGVGAVKGSEGTGGEEAEHVKLTMAPPKSSDSSTKGKRRDDHDNHKKKKPVPAQPSRENLTESTTTTVPLDVYKHMKKDGKRKWRNIEVNSKCILDIEDVEEDSTVTTVSVVVRGEEEKRLKSALVFLNGLKKAYEKNPGHFGGREAGGGTLQEQKEREERMEEKRKGAGGENKGTKRKLFIGGLDREVDTKEMRAYFESYGPVADCIVKTNIKSGESKGFGFCRFEEDEGFNAALKNKAHKMRGKVVVVKIADADASKDGGGSGGSGRGGEVGNNKKKKYKGTDEPKKTRKRKFY